jgi:Na+/proline symporter
MADRLILWAIVGGYILFVVTKGVLKVRNIGTTDDFLVAGRNVGWFFLFCTMGATVIGGGYSIGAIGKTYEWGVLMLLVSTGGYFHFIFSGLVVAPQFREAELYTVAGFFGHRYGEGPRFVMMILSLLFSVFIVAAQMAAFGTVLSAIMPDVASVGSILKWAILIGGSLVVIYSTAGGLIAVINTDFFQFLILMGGFIITLAFCIPDIASSYNSDTGKFIPTRFASIDIAEPAALASMWEDPADSLSRYIESNLTAPEKKVIANVSSEGAATQEQEKVMVGILNRLAEDPNLYNPRRFAMANLTPQSTSYLGHEAEGLTLQRRNLSLLQDVYSKELTRNREIPAFFFKISGDKGWLFLITTFLAFLLGETFAPGYATRYCVGKNIKETKLGIAGVGFFLAFTFPVILFFIALYARIHFPGIDQQHALPMVVKQLNNPVVAGVMIGALLMAVMSSADSALNSSTAIFVKDLFEHQLGWEDKGDGKMLRLARICTAGLGVAAILIAVLWSDIIGLLLFTYHVWAPAVILPVALGALYKKRSKRMNRNILITMIAATVAALSYRGLLTLKNSFDLAIFPDSAYSFMSAFDTAIFGVLVSCIVFAALTLFTRKRAVAVD